ncbi:hypothetical protein D3C80_2135770 [compost metagenome]
MIRMPVLPVRREYDSRSKPADFCGHRSQMLFCHIQAAVRQPEITAHSSPQHIGSLLRFLLAALHCAVR